MALSEDYHKRVLGRKAKGENQAGLAYKMITSFSTAVEQVGALDIVPCSTICISKSERVIIDMLASYFRSIERCLIIVFNFWTPYPVFDETTKGFSSRSSLIISSIF